MQGAGAEKRRPLLAQRRHRLLAMREQKGMLTTSPCILLYQYKQYSRISLCPDHGQTGSFADGIKLSPGDIMYGS